jgi:Zn-dependent metalloprotease
MSAHRRRFHILSIIVILSMLFSGIASSSVSAQGGDGIERQVNAQSGKVSFIGPENGQALAASDALGKSTQPQDPAMALAIRFAPEFGLQDPERDLTEMKSSREENGRVTARYQQTYQGIPVMGGELIVNTNDNGDLYSMNGEVSNALSLSTQPAIDAGQAQQTSLQAVAKWYQKTQNDFVSSQPELWVYDESLLRPSTRPAELVWRVEVKAKDLVMPVRELVLVNAHRGTISLHFNQVDTTWHIDENSGHQAALLGAIWYVSTTGSDSNSCVAPASPCATIDEAIVRAAANDTIKIATGTYMGSGIEVVNIAKGVTLSGGWNASFTTQSGYSTIDGQGERRGVLVSGSPVVIDRFRIQHGFMPVDLGSGAGIHNSGSLTLSNSIVSDNVSETRAGGIYNSEGTLVINNTVISDNIAGGGACGGGGGGGIENYRGTVTLNHSTVSGNRVVCFQGSGIFNYGIGTITLNSSTVSGNYGDVAIYDISQSPLVLNNSTVSHHILGGINKINGQLQANNSTITGNSYGIVLDLAATGNIKNSIVAGNTDIDCFGNLISSGYNLIGTSFNCTFTATTGDLVGTNASPINPRLAPLANNGGPTFTHALVAGSPAINAGNPAAPGGGGNACLGTDQRGVVRPAGIRCDIGAFESTGTWVPPYRVSTYTANSTSSLPGSLVCNQSDPSCSAGDAQAKAAHEHSIGTYNLYAAQHGRNSLNNQGMTIHSTVHYCHPILGCPYANAFWNGTQIAYGDKYGFALADDVVAHELTHGVTESESNLFYYYQSGAINESFSDLWGEYYDQTNGAGTDGYDVLWLQGEDISGSGAGRSMSDPPAYGDPDRMSSALYHKEESDNGGVHHNSGINNKAVSLLVDGGSFNGKTVRRLGWSKTAAIYYEANTNLLSSGADYSDLYFALQQACSNLIGQKGITTGDCVEAKDAIDAVELNAQPEPNFNTDAPLCAAGELTTIAFADNLEAGTGNWTFNNGAHPRWQWDSPYGPFAQSGLHSLYADDFPGQVTDAIARLVPLSIPNNAYLHFAHAYGFESGYNPGDPTFHHFDGGVLEYSINGGTTWTDAGSLINFNGYEGVLFTGSGNPLSGRSAFVGDSHGYISSRLNLASLAGKSVTFRWRMGLDEAAADWGWWVDNVKLYTCTPPPGAFNKTSPSNGATGVGLSTTLSWSSSSSATSYQYCYDILNDSQCNRSWNPVPTTSAGISNLGTNTTYYWQVRAVNAAGTTYANSQSWGSFSTTSTLPAGLSGIEAFVGSIKHGKYSLGDGQSLRESYSGVNNGPVKVASTNSTPLIAAERLIYKFGGVNTSFTEMMGLPNGQLDTTYWLPWYNNVDLDTQLRIANVSGSPATVTITIGGLPMGDPIQLAAGASTRISFAGVNNGPVKIQSNMNIVAAERLIYKVAGVNTSFTEMMALPASQLDTTYWLPWYNNVDLDTQLRIANVSGSPATVTITIGGQSMGNPIQLAAGASTRVSFAGVNSGPVKIVSDHGVPIVAAERLIYRVGGVNTSFIEMMALPASQLDSTYWLPWYNNADLDTQLRFANVHDTQTATVHVLIGGVEMPNSPFTLLPGASTRQSFVGVNSGPVQIVSNVPIVAAERLIYKVGGVNTSFSEMMALPNSQLDNIYWLPWYNNVDLDTQLRFGVP